MSAKERYPLCWPDGWKRTVNRQRARFKREGQATPGTNGERLWGGMKQIAVPDGIDRILDELRRMKISEREAIISTNVRLNTYGLPYSNQKEPSDPGVAVYWERRGKAQCMAVDQYTRVADNLAAIAATLSAMRAIERHGGAQILERAFIGFAALPMPKTRNWRDVLNFGGAATVTVEMVEERYRDLAKLHHPDRGGSAEAFTELTYAREAALRELTVRVAV